MNNKTLVIGTIFVDCKGFSRSEYDPIGRNPGHVEFVHGGVGRNIAQNMGMLGVNTHLLSSVDQSGLGDEVLDRLHKFDVDTTAVQRPISGGTGMWLALLNEHGDLAGSISQMPNLRSWHDFLDGKGQDYIRNFDHVAVELDLDEPLAEKILHAAEGSQGPEVYGLPGNMDVVGQRPDLLRLLRLFICNHVEAAQLFGETSDTVVAMHQNGTLLDRLKQYVEQAEMEAMVLTIGEAGAYYVDTVTQQSGHQPAEKVKVVDTTGAGDAFFSGTVAGMINGMTLGEAVAQGTKVAAGTIESSENNCLDLQERITNDQTISF